MGIPKAFLNTSVLQYSIWTLARSSPPVESPTSMLSSHSSNSSMKIPGSRQRNEGLTDDEECFEPRYADDKIDITDFIGLFLCRYSTSRTEALGSQLLSVLTENCSTRDGAWSIQRAQSTNTVVLQSEARKEDGSFLLTHLPRLHNHEQTFVSLLRFSENDRWIRLVWNKGPQESYSCQDPTNPYLPCIISRKSETIEYQPGGKILKRSAEDDSQALVKKRLSRIW